MEDMKSSKKRSREKREVFGAWLRLKYDLRVSDLTNLEKESLRQEFDHWWEELGATTPAAYNALGALWGRSQDSAPIAPAPSAPSASVAASSSTPHDTTIPPRQLPAKPTPRAKGPPQVVGLVELFSSPTFGPAPLSSILRQSVQSQLALVRRLLADSAQTTDVDASYAQQVDILAQDLSQLSLSQLRAKVVTIQLQLEAEQRKSKALEATIESLDPEAIELAEALRIGAESQLHDYKLRCEQLEQEVAILRQSISSGNTGVPSGIVAQGSDLNSSSTGLTSEASSSAGVVTNGLRILTSDTRRQVELASAAEFGQFKELSAQERAQLSPSDLIKYVHARLRLEDPSTKALAQNLGNALHKLSHDIYSDHSRSILELLQNADDNDYTVDEPTWTASLGSRYVLISNNEKGFTHDNVFALCQIGQSTKKDAAQFTGHKGIGFKAVFKLTAQPHILSNRFSFKFDQSVNNPNKIGFIVPHWVEQDELQETFRRLGCRDTCHNRLTPDMLDPNETHILLPLDADHGVHGDAFVPETLYYGIDLVPLFLRRLKVLIVQHGLLHKSVRVTKTIVSQTATRTSPQDMIDNLSSPSELVWSRYTLNINETEEYDDLDEFGDEYEITVHPSFRNSKKSFYVVSKVVDIPAAFQEARDGRASQSKTQITLAFPLYTEDGQDAPETQRVFSYLPVEVVGLRFVIQADFELNAARDRVHQSPFNKWLLSIIPDLFGTAFSLDMPQSYFESSNDSAPALTDDSSLSELDVRKWLRDRLHVFLPKKDEMNASGSSMWNSLAKAIRAKVLKSPCLLSQSGRLRLPQDILIPPQDYEKLFSNDNLLAGTSPALSDSTKPDQSSTSASLASTSPSDSCKEWVHPSMLDVAKNDFHCESLSVALTLDILEHPSMLELLHSKPLSWFALLFSWLGKNIKDFRLNEAIQDRIMKIPLFPCGSPITHTLQPLLVSPIYNGLVDGINLSTDTVLATLSHLQFGLGIELDEHASLFIRFMGIRPATPLDIGHAIMYTHSLLRPAIQWGTSRLLHQKTLWEHVSFLMTHWAELAPLQPHILQSLLLPIKNPLTTALPGEDTPQWSCFARPSELYACSTHARLAKFLPKEVLDTMLVIDSVPSDLPFSTQDVDNFLWKNLLVSRSFRYESRLLRTFSTELLHTIKLAQAQASKLLADAANHPENPKVVLWSLLLEELRNEPEFLNEPFISSLKNTSWFDNSAHWKLEDAFVSTPQLSAILHASTATPKKLHLGIPILYGCSDDTAYAFGFTLALTQEELKALMSCFKYLKIQDVALFAAAYKLHLQLKCKPDYIYDPTDEALYVRPSKFKSQANAKVLSVLSALHGPVIYKERFQLDLTPFFEPATQYGPYIYIIVRLAEYKFFANPAHTEALIACWEEIDKSSLPVPRAHLLDHRLGARAPMSYYNDGKALMVWPNNEKLTSLFAFYDHRKRGLYPFQVLHPRLAPFSRVLNALKLPKITSIVQVAPTSRVWHGKLFRFAVGPFTTSLPVYQHHQLTALYRNVFKTIDEMSGQFLLDAKDELKLRQVRFLSERLEIFISLVSDHHVPVQYLVYEWAAVTQQEYYVEVKRSRDGDILSARIILPGDIISRDTLLDQILPKACLELLPWFGGDSVTTSVNFFLNMPAYTPEEQTQKLGRFEHYRKRVVKDFETLPLPLSREEVHSSEMALKFNLTATETPLPTPQSKGSGGASSSHLPDFGPPPVVALAAASEVKNLQVNKSYYPVLRLRAAPRPVEHAVPESRVTDASAIQSADSSAKHLQSKNKQDAESEGPYRESLQEERQERERQEEFDEFAPPFVTPLPRSTFAPHHAPYNHGLSRHYKNPYTALLAGKLQRVQEQYDEARRAGSAFSPDLLQQNLSVDDAAASLRDSLFASTPGSFDDLISLQQAYASVLGLQAEHFVYRFLLHCHDLRLPILKTLLPSGKDRLDSAYPVGSKTSTLEATPLDASIWLSTFRALVFPECHAPTSPAAGCDFEVPLSNGKRLLLEVKSHLLETPSEFHLSANEWLVARSVATSSDTIYCILGVYSGAEEFRFLYCLMNPAQMELNGRLVLNPLNYKCHSAPGHGALSALTTSSSRSPSLSTATAIPAPAARTTAPIPSISSGAGFSPLSASGLPLFNGVAPHGMLPAPWTQPPMRLQSGYVAFPSHAQTSLTSPGPSALPSVVPPSQMQPRATIDMVLPSAAPLPTHTPTQPPPKVLASASTSTVAAPSAASASPSKPQVAKTSSTTSSAQAVQEPTGALIALLNKHKMTSQVTFSNSQGQTTATLTISPGGLVFTGTAHNKVEARQAASRKALNSAQIAGLRKK